MIPIGKRFPDSELADMLHVYWRNAGKWRLVAEHQDAARARQMVVVWEETAVQVIDTAILQAQERNNPGYADAGAWLYQIPTCLMTTRGKRSHHTRNF